jgi:NAD(P)-dependent dehydrogenase (short-subunit alcohol dehydrogenase family)
MFLVIVSNFQKGLKQLNAFLVTGANRRIGSAIARDLAAAGHQVMLLCRDERAAENLIRSLPSRQGINALEGDLGTLAGIRAVAG